MRGFLIDGRAPTDPTLRSGRSRPRGPIPWAAWTCSTSRASRSPYPSGGGGGLLGCCIWESHFNDPNHQQLEITRHHFCPKLNLRFSSQNVGSCLDCTLKHPHLPGDKGRVKAKHRLKHRLSSVEPLKERNMLDTCRIASSDYFRFSSNGSSGNCEIHCCGFSTKEAQGFSPSWIFLNFMCLIPIDFHYSRCAALFLRAQVLYRLSTRKRGPFCVWVAGVQDFVYVPRQHRETLRRPRMVSDFETWVHCSQC